MRVWWAAFALLLVSATAHATVGRTETKRERLEREAKNFGPSYSVAYEKIHESFLKDDHAGVDRLARAYLSGSRNKPNREDARYLQALSLIKMNRGEEARQKLKDLERDFSSAEDRAGAAISIADSYYHERNFSAAAAAYEEAIRKYPESEQKSHALERVNELKGPQGGPADAAVTAMQPEIKMPAAPADLLFTVQVGSFSNEKNARALVTKLSRRQYEAYLAMDEAKRMYRVRVGKFPSREDALSLESRLKREGYPTKIYP